MLHSLTLRPIEPNESFFERLFSAQAVSRGGVVRRSVRSVETEVGRDALIAEVQARGFHLVECGGQFIIICNTGQVRLIC